ncbi:hypothetical protein GGU11DRAFT_752394 [Lentinula aff. detonsa]|nr:hypothetical protein GGU11DRAFT_752394 [Lentinula aff. detonsa]
MDTLKKKDGIFVETISDKDGINVIHRPSASKILPIHFDSVISFHSQPKLATEKGLMVVAQNYPKHIGKLVRRIHHFYEEEKTEKNHCLMLMTIDCSGPKETKGFEFLEMHPNDLEYVKETADERKWSTELLHEIRMDFTYSSYMLYAFGRSTTEDDTIAHEVRIWMGIAFQTIPNVGIIIVRWHIFVFAERSYKDASALQIQCFLLRNMLSLHQEPPQQMTDDHMSSVTSIAAKMAKLHLELPPQSPQSQLAAGIAALCMDEDPMPGSFLLNGAADLPQGSTNAQHGSGGVLELLETLITASSLTASSIDSSTYNQCFLFLHLHVNELSQGLL